MMTVQDLTEPPWDLFSKGNMMIFILQVCGSKQSRHLLSNCDDSGTADVFTAVQLRPFMHIFYVKLLNSDVRNVGQYLNHVLVCLTAADYCSCWNCLNLSEVSLKTLHICFKMPLKVPRFYTATDAWPVFFNNIFDSVCKHWMSVERWLFVKTLPPQRDSSTLCERLF